MNKRTYKVFDKKRQKRFPVVSIWFESDIIAGHVTYYKDDTCNTVETIFRNYILRQSTGVEDQTGLLIHDGDMCLYYDGLDDYYYVVEWVYAGWQLVTYRKAHTKVTGIADGMNSCYLEPILGSRLAVIGNIDEQPWFLYKNKEEK